MDGTRILIPDSPIPTLSTSFLRGQESTSRFSSIRLEVLNAQIESRSPKLLTAVNETQGEIVAGINEFGNIAQLTMISQKDSEGKVDKLTLNVKTTDGCGFQIMTDIDSGKLFLGRN